MKAITLLTGALFICWITAGQNGKMRRHAPREKLKSSLADSMRQVGMGHSADTSRALLYNNESVPIDTMSVPRRPGKR